MLPTHHWARNFTIEPDDIEYVTTLLLEKETPLSREELVFALIQRRIDQETARLEERYKDAFFYSPAESYKVGQKLVFPALNYATAIIKDIRSGYNPDYGEFNVAVVQFDGDPRTREFAISLTTPHKLSQQANNGNGAAMSQHIATAEEVLEEAGEEIAETVEAYLSEQRDLAVVAHKWFPRDLILEVNEGHLHLAEAILDINAGGPLEPGSIVGEIGGISPTSPISLQVFSMNYALNQDRRFVEVGPAGEVLWYLTRMLPPETQATPAMLRHNPIEYDRRMLDAEMLRLEADINDELSPIEPVTSATSGTATIIYPHRRAGTLPLNAQTRHVFPSARRTTHIWITLVDGHDDEAFTGWVVPSEQYVYGLGGIYRKYSLPIGAHLTVSKTDDPGKIRIDLGTYRPRMEWIRLITPRGEVASFENSKRSIGADFDDLMILGIDDLEALDAMVKTIHQQRRTLAAIMRMLIPELGRLTPQGTAHIKTIYSAVNVIRRMPPGPIMATLRANPDFEDVGGHYWKLAEF